MQRTEEKRRCSILKKRRSRSLSPNMPEEQTARRASRRISFSGKHNVREFFTNENTAIVWGETYDISEKQSSSNEQITLQSTRISSMSTTLQTTRNESMAMDMSSTINASAPEKRISSFGPSFFRQPHLYSEDQKENIEVKNDSDIQLSFVMPPPPSRAATLKSIFATSLKPTLFQKLNTKKEVIETPPLAEKTTGSDNMDISGIEPTENPPQSIVSESGLKNWFQQNDFAAKPKNENINRRQTTNQVVNIKLDDSLIVESPIKIPQNNPVSHKSINYPAEMSLEIEDVKQLDVYETSMLIESPPMKIETHSTRRQTINQVEDMEMEMSKIASPIIQQNLFTHKQPSQTQSRRTIIEPKDVSLDEYDQSRKNIAGHHMSIAYLQEEALSSRRQTTHQPHDMDIETVAKTSPKQSSTNCKTNRKTIHQPQDMTIDDFTNQSKVNHSRITELSVQLLPRELPSNRRQTTHKAQDISIDIQTVKPTNKPAVNDDDEDDIQLQDMSLDTHQWSNSPVMQQRIPSQKKAAQSTNRMTINEPTEMSFDSNATGKSNAYSRNNKTILTDLSMDLQSTETYAQQQIRKSVICKSPSKNATRVFNESSLEYTKAIDPYVSYHPLHSTKLADTNCSRFDASIEESFAIEEPYEVQAFVAAPAAALTKRTVQMFNQNQSARMPCEMDMSEEDSPLPTSKKFNLNKTPYYVGNDLLDTMRVSDTSSLDLTNNSLNEHLHQANENQYANEQNRKTIMFHATIKDDSQMRSGGSETNVQPIEISDDSNSSDHIESVYPSIGNQRNTCSQAISMNIESMPTVESKRISIPNQSLFQLSSMDLDASNQTNDSNPKESPQPKNVTNRLSGSMNEFTFNESKQLTFIEDDEDEEQICNTKIDFACSFDGSEINDSVERKCPSSVGNQTCEISRFSLHSNATSLSSSVNPFRPQSNEMVPSERGPIPLLKEELQAFQRKDRLRHSNVFDGNDTGNSNRSEATFKGEPPNAGPSLAQISQSSIMQRRGQNSAKDDANESSFLLKRPNKPLSEIKLDFSGYDKLAGLATVSDVIDDFCNRMEELRRQDRQRAEQIRKFTTGEIDSVDLLNNNDEELVSQNIEAPSWTFLTKNKIDCELEEARLERAREREARLPGAHKPIIPSTNILMLNKCRNMNNWTFDDVWYFEGNIRLCNDRMPVFKVCLVYDPDTAYGECEKYGMIKFIRIIPDFCKVHLSERKYAPFLLEVQELRSKLPKNLLPMCETSSSLSNIDDKLHEYCVKALNQVAEIKAVCKKTKALIKSENGIIYIFKPMVSLKNELYQEFIIELSDIDTTDWLNVRTNPRRTLNEEIKNLPKGIPFIKELLENRSKYVPWQ